MDSPDRRRLGIGQERRARGARGFGLPRDQQPAAGDGRRYRGQPRARRADPRGDRARRQDRPRIARALARRSAPCAALGVDRALPVPRRQDRYARQALLGNAAAASFLERRAHADRGDRARARVARADARRGLRVRHERPARGGAARLDQGLRRGRPVEAHAPLRVVRLQARRAARCRSRFRRALPAQSALRGSARAADRTRPGRRRVPRARARGRAHVQRHLPLRRAAGCPTTRATTATT